MTRNLEIYLSLERQMVGLDETGDPLAERFRDLMDSVWYRLSPEEVAALDARGSVDPWKLVPVFLSVPAPTPLEPPTVTGRAFNGPNSQWHAPSDWRNAA